MLLQFSEYESQKVNKTSCVCAQSCTTLCNPMYSSPPGSFYSGRYCLYYLTRHKFSVTEAFLSLPPSPSIPGQQCQWSDVLWRVTAAKTRHDSSTYPVVQGRAKTLRSQRPWARESFHWAQKNSLRLWSSWRDDSEKVRPGRRQAARLRFLFQCHAFLRIRKRVDQPLPYM